AVKDLLSWLFSRVKEQQHSHDDRYGDFCLKAAVSLLETICKNMKSNLNHEIHLVCLDLVSLIAETAFHLQTKEVTNNLLENTRKEKLKETMAIIKEWLRITFKNKLVNNIDFAYMSETKVWNKLISLKIGSEEFTQYWRNTFLNDFEGKLKQETSMHQIEIYINKIEEVSKTLPFLENSLEKCALEAVTVICQAR
ncbi:unnamed protein product, partial [Oncorhynchus mykiss]